jgi:hypothetical protein
MPVDGRWDLTRRLNGLNRFSVSVGCDYIQQADIPISHVNRAARSTGQETVHLS